MTEVSGNMKIWRRPEQDSKLLKGHTPANVRSFGRPRNLDYSTRFGVRGRQLPPRRKA